MANGCFVGQAREGPVQFEKEAKAVNAVDTADPFEIDAMITDVMGGKKRYGVQDPDPRASKRARVEDDDLPT